jgi:predicted Zn-ribbon and HTH transcriptional regulator
MSWLRDLFKSKCPKCKSTHIHEVPRMTFTYFLYFACDSCGYEWKESGL